MNNDLGAWRDPMNNAKATGNAQDVIHNTIKDQSAAKAVEGLKTLGIGSHKVSVQNKKTMSETTNKAKNGAEDLGKMQSTGSITKISKKDRIKRGFGGAKYEMKINYEHGEIVVKLSKKDIKNLEKQQNTEGGQRKQFEPYYGEDESEVDDRKWTTVKNFNDDVAASYPANEAIPSAPLQSMYAPSAPMETYRPSAPLESMYSPSAPMETYRPSAPLESMYTPSAPMETYRPETDTVKKQPSTEVPKNRNNPDLNKIPPFNPPPIPEEDQDF